MIRYSFFTVLLLLLVACSNEEQQLDEQFFVEEKELTDGELVMQLTDSLKKDPENIRLLIQKGNLCKDLLDFNCALDAGAKAFRVDSTNIEARQLYAWTLINKPDAPISDIERAQRHYQYVLSVMPNDPKTLVELANTFSLTGDFKTAMKYTNDALRIDERYRDAYVLKGSIYKVLENYEFALSSYQTAIQLDPEFFMGHLNTGWLLTSMGDHKLALEYYENAHEIKPDNLNALYGVAKSLQDIGQYDEALINYRRLIEIEPKFYVSFFNQGFIKQYYQDEPDSASYFYQEVLDINPNYIRAWYQLGELYYAQGEHSRAADAYAEALKLDENFEPAIEGVKKVDAFFTKR